MFRRHGNFGLVFIIGVQSNQYPRAVDIARPLRAAGIQVAIGGLHVSGCLSMLDGMQPDLQEALDLGITLFASEFAEPCDILLRGAAAGQLKPIYSYQGSARPARPRGDAATDPAQALPHLQPDDQLRRQPRLPVRMLVLHHHQRAGPQIAPPLAGRRREADPAKPRPERELVLHHRRQFRPQQGLGDDLDRIIEVRREVEGAPRDLKIIIQLDTLCHKNPNLKAKLAGVRLVFIGLETINQDHLAAAKKRRTRSPNIGRSTPASSAMRATSSASLTTRRKASPRTSPSSRKACRSTFCLSPFPGSQDHQKLWKRKVPMDADMNRYHAEHVVTAHPKTAAL